MGGLFGGGSKPKKPEPVGPTAEETELARQGIQRFDRYQQRYAPLEDAAVRDINRPTQRLEQGRTNADIMQEATFGAARSMGSGNIAEGISSLRQLSSSISRAGAQGVAGSFVGSRARKDDRAFSMIETGLGMSGRQVDTLSQLGQQANQRAITDLRATMAEQDARMQASQARQNALVGLAGTAVGAYGAHRAEARQTARFDRMTRAPALRDLRDY